MGRLIKMHRFGTTIICLSLIAGPSRASAQNLHTEGEMIAGAIAGTAAVGVGVVIALSIRATHRLEGCTVGRSGAIELRRTNHEQTWTLLGDTASLKPGQHVRVSGKRGKKNGVGMRNFTVEKVIKNLGPCS